jgi:hypothetical protein
LHGDAFSIKHVEFYDYARQSPILADFGNRLPAGFELRYIDKSLLDRCEWRDDMSFSSGSLDNFLLNGLRLCLIRGYELIV